MDPIRRLIFLALFASVVMAEPTQQMRALTAAMIADAAEARPTLVPGAWVRRLSALLRKTVRPIANVGPRRSVRRIDAIRAWLAPANLAWRPHATFSPHAFRLPPPLI